MTPAEQIHLETSTLTKQITDLISAFEARTGAYVARLAIAPYLPQDRPRLHFQDPDVQIVIGLKPEEKPKQV